MHSRRYPRQSNNQPLPWIYGCDENDLACVGRRFKGGCTACKDGSDPVELFSNREAEVRFALKCVANGKGATPMPPGVVVRDVTWIGQNPEPCHAMLTPLLSSGRSQPPGPK
jgi:hypothetical protein